MAPELTESLREVAERAAGVLGPESAIFEDMDAAGFGGALGKAVGAAVMRPVTPIKSAVHLATSLVADLQLMAAAATWVYAAQIQGGGLSGPETAAIVSLSGGALFENVVSVVLLLVETVTYHRSQ